MKFRRNLKKLAELGVAGFVLQASAQKDWMMLVRGSALGWRGVLCDGPASCL